MLPSPLRGGLGLWTFALSRPPMRSLSLRPDDLLTIPRMALSIGFRNSVSFLPAIQASRPLTFALAGLSPAERASFRWTHHVGCGFAALRVPPHFTTRLMRPIESERRRRTMVGRPLGTQERVPAVHTTNPCSPASTPSLGAGDFSPGGSEPSSLPSLGCTRSTDWSGPSPSNSPNLAE